MEGVELKLCIGVPILSIAGVYLSISISREFCWLACLLLELCSDVPVWMTLAEYTDSADEKREIVGSCCAQVPHVEGTLRKPLSFYADQNDYLVNDAQPAIMHLPFETLPMKLQKWHQVTIFSLLTFNTARIVSSHTCSIHGG